MYCNGQHDKFSPIDLFTPWSFLLLFFHLLNRKCSFHSLFHPFWSTLCFAAFHDVKLLLMKLNTSCRCFTVNVTWKDYFSWTAGRLLMWNRWRSGFALTANSRWEEVRKQRGFFLKKKKQSNVRYKTGN